MNYEIDFIGVEEHTKDKPGILERERWAVFKQTMIIIGVNEENFCKMYEKAFLDGDITIEQITKEISFNIDDILIEKFNRIEHQEISMDIRLQAWKKTKETCEQKLKKSNQSGSIADDSGIIVVKSADNEREYGLDKIKPEHLSLVEDFLSGKITTYNDLYCVWRKVTPFHRPNQHMSVGTEEIKQIHENWSSCWSMEDVLQEMGHQLGVAESELKIYIGDY